MISCSFFIFGNDNYLKPIQRPNRHYGDRLNYKICVGESYVLGYIISLGIVCTLYHNTELLVVLERVL